MTGRLFNLDFDRSNKKKYLPSDIVIVGEVDIILRTSKLVIELYALLDAQWERQMSYPISVCEVGAPMSWLNLMEWSNVEINDCYNVNDNFDFTPILMWLTKSDGWLYSRTIRLRNSTVVDYEYVRISMLEFYVCITTVMLFLEYFTFFKYSLKMVLIISRGSCYLVFLI